ncbi:MAG: hypothetical protein PHI34_07690, partial [Acidobacteriota bacterium]|nr:hypothetical protein [Acidobacteriota bacterium]
VDLLLLRRAAIPVGARYGLVAVHFYNLANFLVGSFLWVRGDWPFSLGGLKVRLHSWPILKSSLLLALFVYAAVEHRKILAWGRALWSDIRIRVFVLGFLAGYAPALYGYLTGASPSSPGGLASLGTIVKNVWLAVPEMTSRLAGASGILPFRVFAIAAVASGYVVLGRSLWKQTKRRLRDGAELSPYYPVLALFFATAALGLLGNRLGDANTTRFFVPLFFCLPIGLALGLKDIAKKSRLLAAALVAVFLANSLMSHLLVLRHHASPARYELVARNLAAENIKGGYADYWSAYYLTFLTREEIILAPSNGKERYSPYGAFVRSLDEIVLIGESISADRDSVAVKGIEYEVVKRDVWEGLPVARFKKKPGSDP